MPARKYAVEPVNAAKSTKARGSDLRIHYKNTRETVAAVRGMKLRRAKQYLNAVLAHKECVPFTIHKRGTGRTAQASAWGVTQGRWPKKSVQAVLDLLQNAEANAEFKGLDIDSLYVSHIEAQAAQRGRRRTYRAHGRINAYMSSPTHIQLILSEKEAPVPKSTTANEGEASKTRPVIKRNKKSTA